MSNEADGFMLYPSSGLHIDETALIQGHRIRFVTVYLSCASAEVVKQLRAIPTSSMLGADSVKIGETRHKAVLERTRL